jgi:Zn-finger nucleic acid-binding protein
MKCPVDGSTLENYVLDSVEVEKCPQCQGLWFTKGEIRQAEEAEEVDEHWVGFDLWSDHEAYKAEKSSRKCPTCDQNMATILYGPTEIKVDYCMDEHGV